MTKEELLVRIQEYEIPVQPSQLRSYSQDRLEDYLKHLEVMGQKRDSGVGIQDSGVGGTR